MILFSMDFVKYPHIEGAIFWPAIVIFRHDVFCAPGAIITMDGKTKAQRG